MIHQIRYCLLIVAAVLPGTFLPVYAQMQFPGMPLGPTSHLKAAEVMYVLPPVNQLEVEARMESTRNAHFKTFEFAKVRPVDISPETHGSWQIREGNRVWMAHLISPGAYSLGLVFNEYSLEPGVKVFVYDPDMRQVKGAFTSGNNKKSGILPVGHMDGQEVIVEMQVPGDLADYGKLHIESLSHGYIDLKARLGTDDCDPGVFGCSQDCMIDVNCQEGSGWQKEKRSVVRIFTTRQYCTGVLVNNTSYDGTPYILTAEHCISSQGYADQTVFLFNYESPSCFGGDGDVGQSIAGGELLATGDSIDFSLIRLSLTPPAEYDPFYAGWDHRGDQNTASVTIHHPWGDVKKITRDDQPPSVPSKPSDVPYTDLDDYHYFSFWWIKNWEMGSTQGGSSGSPLFNGSGRLIGLLSGGVARCGDSIGFDGERVIYDNSFNYDDYFTQMNYSWDYYEDDGASLASWLDPGNSGASFLNGYDPVGLQQPGLPGTKEYTLYPNPVRQHLNVSRAYPVAEKRTFEVVSLSGALVLSGQLEYSGESRIDVSPLSQGIYLLRISGTKILETQKFVIVR
jgi:hypothetical protein